MFVLQLNKDLATIWIRVTAGWLVIATFEGVRKERLRIHYHQRVLTDD